MDRRRFLQSMAAATAGINAFTGVTDSMASTSHSPGVDSSGLLPASAVRVEGHTLLCTFHRGSEIWNVYKDLKTREGGMTFVAADGSGMMLSKSAEAAFADANPPYLGLNMREIGLAGSDLLADQLLQNGEPDPEQVRRA